jgi:hypothetical protein
MVELLNVEVTMEFLKSSIVSFKAFITQRCVNRFGCYLVDGEYAVVGSAALSLYQRAEKVKVGATG